MTRERHVEITMRDPLIARDGRPFGSGANHRMRPLDWFYPSVAAGSMRTWLGKSLGWGFEADQIQQLLAAQQGGLFPFHDGCLHVPGPRDAVFVDSAQAHRARPAAWRSGEGSWPLVELDPVILPDSVTEDFKPAPTPYFWPLPRIVEWLTEQALGSFKNSVAFDHDERWHVALDDPSGVAKDEMLFVTAGLTANAVDAGEPINPERTLSMRVTSAPWPNDAKPVWHPMGGERRMALWNPAASHGTAWACPLAITRAVKNCQRIRMALVSPGLFKNGSLPGWLNERLEGSIPGTTVRVRLNGVSLDRWRPISGYSLDRANRGEKPVRRLVPAGAVYFFTRLDDLSTELPVEQLWLRSVGDYETHLQDAARDGFSLAVWGTWTPNEENA